MIYSYNPIVVFNYIFVCLFGCFFIYGTKIETEYQLSDILVFAYNDLYLV